jgi:hypothetical protein
MTCMVEQKESRNPTGQGSVTGALGGQESLSPHNYLLKKVCHKEFDEVTYVDKAEYERYLEAEQNFRLIATFYTPYNKYGGFENNIFVSRTSLYLVREWVSKNEDSVYSETQVYRFILPDDAKIMKPEEEAK